MDQRSSRPSPAGIVGLVGGLLAVGGSILVWFTVKADTSKFPGGSILSKSVKGTEGSDGKITLVTGIVVLLAAVGIWLMAGGARKALVILGGIAGLIAGGLGIYDVLTAKTQIIDAAVKDVGSSAGLSADQVRSFLEKAFDSGILKVSPGMGIMLVVAGGAVAVVAAVMGLAGGREPSRAAAGAEVAPSMPASGFEPAAPAMPMPQAGPMPSSPIPMPTGPMPTGPMPTPSSEPPPPAEPTESEPPAPA